jgi:hypothetical protein
MPSKLRTRLRAILRRSQMDRELDEELRYHSCLWAQDSYCGAFINCYMSTPDSFRSEY